jgi:hypothetical protein
MKNYRQITTSDSFLNEVARSSSQSFERRSIEIIIGVIIIQPCFNLDNCGGGKRRRNDFCTDIWGDCQASLDRKNNVRRGQGHVGKIVQIECRRTLSILHTVLHLSIRRFGAYVRRNSPSMQEQHSRRVDGSHEAGCYISYGGHVHLKNWRVPSQSIWG